MQRPVWFVGDIHLGRRPSGLDDALGALGLSAAALAAAEAWRRTVDAAIEAKARAVVLAGDVVDAENDRFEAYRHLQHGAQRLAQSGIPLFAVAGNHDSLVLPRLADQVDGVHLLGAQGRWERVELQGEGPPIDLLGWSFPSRVVRVDPTTQPDLEERLAEARPSASVLGVVHGDLGQATSRYAPIAAAHLQSPRVHGWFLGHIHQPHDLAATSRPVGYLGSLVGLDPGEPGARGPWEVHVGDGVSCVQQVLGPIRWDRLDVEIGEDAVDVDDLVETLRAASAAHVRAIDTERIDALALRVTLVGRTAHRDAIRELVDRPAVDLAFRAAGMPVVVETVRDGTLPALDLEALARDPSPAGHLAATLQGLLREPPDPDRLAWADRLIGHHLRGRWDLGEDAPPPDPRTLAIDACRDALDQLLATRQGGV